MRTFTSVYGDRLLAAATGARLEELVTALAETVIANAAMSEHYQSMKAALA